MQRLPAKIRSEPARPYSAPGPSKQTRKLRMFKLPQSIVFAILAFNLTLFTIMLQMDLLIFNSLVEKVIAWLVALALWVLTYMRRKKYFTLF
jgi:hypothetical protein